MSEEREDNGGRQIAAPTEERTPELIGSEIRMYYEAGRRVTMLCAIEIGRRLNEVKELLAHGEWLPWLQREAPFSDRHAQNYIRIYREYGAAQQGLFGPETNAKYISDLPINKALLLLAVPEEERDAFAKEVEADRLSTDELKEAIAARKAAEERALEAERALHELEESEGLAVAELQEKLEAAERRASAAAEEARRAAEGVGPYREKLEAAETEAAQLRAQIRELEERPIEVAVERDEKAIEEAAMTARAKAEAEAAEKISALKKKLEKAENARDKLKSEAEKAGAAAQEKADTAAREAAEKLAAAERESERNRQEAEALRKKLAASDRDVTEFGVHFKSVQAELRALSDSLGKIEERDAALGAKLRGALRQVLAPFAGAEAGETDCHTSAEALVRNDRTEAPAE